MNLSRHSVRFENSSGNQLSDRLNSVRFYHGMYESPQEHSCEIISNSGHRFSKRSRLKLFSIYSPGGHFVFNRAEWFEQFLSTVT